MTKGEFVLLILVIIGLFSIIERILAVYETYGYSVSACIAKDAGMNAIRGGNPILIGGEYYRRDDRK